MFFPRQTRKNIVKCYRVVRLVFRMKNLKEKLKSIKLKHWHLFLIVFGILFVSLSAFHSNLWFDESYSVGMARHSFQEIWTIGGNDVHPVLYYWLLRIIYLVTGGSIMAYRLFSCIPIAMMIILGYTHIRKDFGEKTGFIFSFLSVFLPCMATYAVEIRMYSCAILAVTLLAIYAYRLSKEDNTKNWFIFGISSLACIFLHYYGLMAAGLINVILLIYLIRKKRKKGLAFLLAFGLLQTLLYLPWLMYFVKQLGQISHGYWITFEFPLTIKELLSSQMRGYMKLDIPTVLSIELYIYIIYKVYQSYKAKENLKPFACAAGTYLLVILAAGMVTLVMNQSILNYRYLFVVTGLYIFAISFILAKEKNTIEIVAILSAITILCVHNNLGMVKDNYHPKNDVPLKYLQENIKKDDTLVIVDIGAGSIAAILYPDNQVYFYDGGNWGVAEAYKAFGPNFETYVTQDYLEKCSDRIWLFEYPGGKQAEEIEKISDYRIVSKKEFSTRYRNYIYGIVLLEKKAS